MGLELTICVAVLSLPVLAVTWAIVRRPPRRVTLKVFRWLGFDVEWDGTGADHQGHDQLTPKSQKVV